VRTLLAEELTSLREDIVGLMTAAVEVGGAALDQGEALVVTGERNLLDSGDLASNMDRLRQALRSVRAEDLAAAPARPSQKAEGVQLYIGGESGSCRSTSAASSPRRTP
jgi:heat-inducible transcriptional repressor